MEFSCQIELLAQKRQLLYCPTDKFKLLNTLKSSAPIKTEVKLFKLKKF